MINKLEILDLASSLTIQINTIEKDYVLGWILMGIERNRKINNSWIFKGGTCLKKCFFHDYRFSEDLDFTLKDFTQFDESFLKIVINEVSDWVMEESGIEIPQNKHSINFYTNLQGSESCQIKISYLGPLRQKQRSNLPTIKLDITPNEKVVLPPERRTIFHPYSDKPHHPSKILCYSYEEIFAEKLRALAERARPRDLYDIIHLYKNASNIEKIKFLSSLEQKCAFKRLPPPTLKTIEKHPQKALLSSEWKNMLDHQLANLSSFDSYWKQLPEVFEWISKK